MRNTVGVKKLLNKIMKYSDRPDKASLVLIKEFGQWVDIKIFSKALEKNLIDDMIKFKKVIKEVSDNIYLEVSEQFEDGVIDDISKVENLEDVISDELKKVKSEEVKEIIKAIF